MMQLFQNAWNIKAEGKITAADNIVQAIQN
jgi:hypothetical protein